MGRTPDRLPGPLVEDEEIRLGPNATPPTRAGAFNFNGSAFQMRDALGTFDPRGGVGFDESKLIVDAAGCLIYVGDGEVLRKV